MPPEYATPLGAKNLVRRVRVTVRRGCDKGEGRWGADFEFSEGIRIILCDKCIARAHRLLVMMGSLTYEEP